MKYRNTKTGNVISVPCPVFGPDWEEIGENPRGMAEAPAKATEPEKKPARKKSKESGNNG